MTTGEFSGTIRIMLETFLGEHSGIVRIVLEYPKNKVRVTFYKPKTNIQFWLRKLSMANKPLKRMFSDGAFMCYGNYGKYQKPMWKTHMNTPSCGIFHWAARRIF